MFRKLIFATLLATFAANSAAQAASQGIISMNGVRGQSTLSLTPHPDGPLPMPWPRGPWPMPRPLPWPGPWCLSCPPPGGFDHRINPQVIDRFDTPRVIDRGVLLR